jgi:hypothetical protein
MLNTFFQKACHIYVEKYFRAVQAIHDDMARALHGGYLRLNIHTQNK